MRVSSIQQKIAKACRDFNLISPGDRIMIGLSGGKDSLTMCDCLCVLRDAQTIPFDIACAHVQFSNIPYRCDLAYLQQWCDERRVSLDIVEDDIRPAHIGDVLRFTCIHCARFRRAKLLEQSRLRNCNKLALGHHLDDIVATLLMNMSQHGKFAGMAVKLDLEVGEQKWGLALIRPLCYVTEDDIRAFVSDQGYKLEKCRCNWSDDGVRAKVRETVDVLSAFDANARMNLFRSQFNMGRVHTEDQFNFFDIEETDACTLLSEK
jgi:tRNA(Ile)-lysidine synthase TilS/MesJ